MQGEVVAKVVLVLLVLALALGLELGLGLGLVGFTVASDNI